MDRTQQAALPRVAVVLPCYRVRDRIASGLDAIPPVVGWLVDDADLRAEFDARAREHARTNFARDAWSAACKRLILNLWRAEMGPVHDAAA